jgi:hypothetical protein
MQSDKGCLKQKDPFWHLGKETIRPMNHCIVVQIVQWTMAFVGLEHAWGFATTVRTTLSSDDDNFGA